MRAPVINLFIHLPPLNAVLTRYGKSEDDQQDLLSKTRTFLEWIRHTGIALIKLCESLRVVPT